MRIGLFIPCYIDAIFPKVGIATLELRGQRGSRCDERDGDGASHGGFYLSSLMNTLRQRISPPCVWS